ncbi:uncharacterized protein LOC121925949 [Sceloporus undulatus]|uniref:uncharacterized protein LOC121925949 n=1 Tax=Sceloporus undulatus TaxID=8520 RepID=UPI001C4C99F9|nr:uncharacterized protein LOC121925949 [Sceloporus undulatus]
MSEAKISESCVAVSTGTKNARQSWIAAKGASIFQSRHMNAWLREQINCLINEGNNIKANIWDLQETMRNMKAELKRIKQAEDKITYLETEIETVRKNQEEENTGASSEDQYLKKLEKDNENLHLRIFMLSEKSSALTASRKINQQSYLQLCCHVNKLRRELQESKLTCMEEDEVFTKMKHQIRELEEYIQEYEVKIQVLEDREKTLKNELSAVVKDKTRRQIKFQGKFLNLHPKSLMYEIARAELEEKMQREEKSGKEQLCGGRLVKNTFIAKIVWIFIVLWRFTGILRDSSPGDSSHFFILSVGLSNHTVTEDISALCGSSGLLFQPYIELVKLASYRMISELKEAVE